MTTLGDIITAPNGTLHLFIGTNPSGGVVTVVRAKRDVRVYVDFVLVSTSAPAPFSLVDTPRRKRKGTAACACGRDVLPGFKHCDGCGVPVPYTGKTEVLV